MPPAAALPALTPGSSSRPSEGPQPHHAAPPPWNPLGNPLPDCSLHTQNPSQPGPAAAWSLPRCWLVAGSDRSIPTGQQPQQRGSLWEPWQTSLLAQAKMGAAGGCHAGPSLQCQVWAPTTSPEGRKSWRIYFSNDPKGVFLCIQTSAALLALHSPSHIALWNKPILNEQHGSSRMFSLLSCARAGISSLREMLLQTLSWLAHSRHHSSASSAQLFQGWKPITSKLEHAKRQNLLHPHQLLPGQGCWNDATVQLAGWILHGARQDFFTRLCSAAAGDQQRVTSNG